MTDLTEKEQFLTNLLLDKNIISREELQQCISIREQTKKDPHSPPLLDLMVEKGLISKKMARSAKNMYSRRKKRKERNSRENDSEKKQNTIIPGYEIKQQLGRGTSGKVYLARQKSLDRSVAIKVLTKDIKKDEKYRKRFLREARLAAKFNHLNIINAIDAGIHNGLYYFVMEYVKGHTFDRYLERTDDVSISFSVDVVRQITRALFHADEHGLIHRDIKPENILISKDGTAKLCDLGLAKSLHSDPSLTATDKTIGTPYYMSPEQVRGEDDLDIRADLYSLGATLYHALTGKVPFDGPSIPDVLSRQVNDQPVPPRRHRKEISQELNRVVMKLLRKQREDRYNSPQEVLDELDRVEQKKYSSPPSPKQKQRPGASTTRTSTRYTSSSRNSSDRFLVVAAVFCMIAFFVGGLYVSNNQKNQAPSSPANSITNPEQVEQGKQNQPRQSSISPTQSRLSSTSEEKMEDSGPGD